MQFFLLILLLIIVFNAIQCETPPNNTYHVPLLDFSINPINKSSLCSTPKCCPIALTFDDGPDEVVGGPTDTIINYLYNNNIPATFFMTTDVWANVETSLVAQQFVKNIVEYGFDLGSHTINHKDLTTLSAVDIKNEIVGVQTTLNKFMSPAPRLSLFRAPYGMPYSNSSQAEMDRVSKIVADIGYFHVGWQINPNDWNCRDNITCVTEPIFTAVDTGQWGIILLHFVWRNTANALPTLIAGLRQRGCEFFGIEQFVQIKYGESSADAMDDYNRKSSAVNTRSAGLMTVIFIFCTFFLYY